VWDTRFDIMRVIISMCIPITFKMMALSFAYFMMALSFVYISIVTSRLLILKIF